MRWDVKSKDRGGISPWQNHSCENKSSYSVWHFLRSKHALQSIKKKKKKSLTHLREASLGFSGFRCLFLTTLKKKKKSIPHSLYQWEKKSA